MITSKKITSEELTRRDRREMLLATKKFNSLFNAFVEFKNNHIKFEEHKLIIAKEVYEKLEELNVEWKKYCYSYKTNTAHQFKHDVVLFREKCNDHIHTHELLVWMNFVVYTCKHKYNFIPKTENVKKLFDKFSDLPYQACILLKQNLKSGIMHLLEIPEKKIKKSYPSEITELNQKQFVFFMDLVLQFRLNIIDIHKFRVEWLRYLLKLKKSVRYEKICQLARRNDQYKEVLDNIHSNIHILCETLDSFFIKDEKGEMLPNLEFYNNLQPFIKVSFLKFFKKKLIGPADTMMNCSFYEYKTAHEYLIEFSKDQSELNMAKIIATLYRPKKSFSFFLKFMPKFSGDIRKNFCSKTNPIFFDKRVQKINKLPMSYKMGIVQFYLNMEELLKNGTVDIGGNEISLKLLYERNDEYVSTSPDIGLSGIAMTIAETGIFGNMDALEHINMWDVIALLYKNVKEANDTKAYYKKQSPNVEP